jgi:hypothetical protein
MKRLEICIPAILVALVLGLSTPQKAEARLQYYKGFEKAYGKTIEGVDDAKCGICHGGEKGKNKKKLSKYADEFREALGKEDGKEAKDTKNVKDADKIDAALKAVEAKEVEAGKTYGDLLKSGKLPPAAEE